MSKSCGFCNAPHAKLMCSICRKIRYCNQDHQRKHWLAEHKMGKCGELAKAAKAAKTAKTAKAATSSPTFAIGDQGRVHQLQSVAGQKLNGQIVTIEAAVQRETELRYQCLFTDGTRKNIKSSNLKEYVPVTSTSKDDSKNNKNQEDPCPICMEEVLIHDADSFRRYTCCGKIMHMACSVDMSESNLNHTQKFSCTLCRSKNPSEGSKEDLARLNKWIKQGKAWSMKMLGDRYSEGVGVNKNDKRAAELYTLAANLGDINAQFDLGYMYANGQGVPEDCKRALELYTLAAEQGSMDAQFNIGGMYVQGMGVERSLNKAKQWLTKAANQGHKKAIEGLRRLG